MRGHIAGAAMAVPVRCLRRIAGLPRRHPPARHCSSLTPKTLYQSRLDGGELHVDEHQSAVVEHLERLHSRLKKYDLFHCISAKCSYFMISTFILVLVVLAAENVM